MSEFILFALTESLNVAQNSLKQQLTKRLDSPKYCSNAKTQKSNHKHATTLKKENEQNN